MVEGKGGKRVRVKGDGGRIRVEGRKKGLRVERGMGEGWKRGKG